MRALIYNLKIKILLHICTNVLVLEKLSNFTKKLIEGNALNGLKNG